MPQTKFKKIGVIGAGFMGAGIAYVTAKAGIPVVLIDRDMEAADKGKAHSDERSSPTQVKKGRAKPDEAAKLLSLITPSADYAASRGLPTSSSRRCSRIPKSRRRPPRRPRPCSKASAIFASNTSTIPITALAKNSARPKNFIGIHFFSPVDKMMLVEIILGKKTGDKALALAIDFVRAIKKTPIVVNDTRGFYVNRCVLRYMSEAYKMLIEGVPAAMIENAARPPACRSARWRSTDETAIDLAQKIMHQTRRDLGEKAVDPAQMALIDTHGRQAWPLRPQERQGLLRLSGQARQEAAVAGPEGPLSSSSAREGRLRGAEAAPAGHHRAGGRARRWRRASSPIRARPMSAPSSPSASRPIPAARCPTSTAWARKNFVKLAKTLQKKYGADFKAPKLLVDMAEKGETFYQRFDPYAEGGREEGGLRRLDRAAFARIAEPQGSYWVPSAWLRPLLRAWPSAHDR